MAESKDPDKATNAPEQEGALRVLIVDDERHARENLNFLLETYCPSVQVVGMAATPNEAVKLFAERRPQLIFLDIRMPSGSEGFDVLESLRGESFFVVFVTAFKDHALKAFTHGATHYLLKPIDAEDLVEAVERVRKWQGATKEGPSAADALPELKRLQRTFLQHQAKRLVINHNKGSKVVLSSDISYLQASGNCTLLHFTDGSQYLDTRTLKVYEDLLGEGFFRVHRSYLVNIAEIDELRSDSEFSAVMKCRRSVPIARDRRRSLLERLQN